MRLNVKQMPVSGALAPLDPPIALAPLAGITDLPFRNLVSRFGAGLVVSEMVASQEMVQAKPGVRERAELGCEVSKTAVQLAGRDPYWMGEAARHITDQGAAVIDINMGCPAKKVTNGLSGSALMRDLDHALRLIEATVAATHLPVTLKTRLGWDDDTLNAADLARRAEAAGVQRIVIHGRTRCQFYKGRANWHAIAAVTEAVSIPVLANGDILDGATATAAMDASGAAGVMVGRGAQGRPWLLAQIASELWGHKAPSVPQGADRADLVAGHYEDILSFYGIELGVRVARKHLGWYLEDSPCTPELRRHVLTERDPKAVLQRLKDAFPAVEYRGAAA